MMMRGGGRGEGDDRQQLSGAKPNSGELLESLRPNTQLILPPPASRSAGSAAGAHWRTRPFKNSAPARAKVKPTEGFSGLAEESSMRKWLRASCSWRPPVRVHTNTGIVLGWRRASAYQLSGQFEFRGEKSSCDLIAFHG